MIRKVAIEWEKQERGYNRAFQLYWSRQGQDVEFPRHRMRLKAELLMAKKAIGGSHGHISESDKD